MLPDNFVLESSILWPFFISLCMPIIVLLLAYAAFRRSKNKRDARTQDIVNYAVERGYACRPRCSLHEAITILESLSELPVFSTTKYNAEGIPKAPQLHRNLTMLLSAFGALPVANLVEGESKGYRFRQFEYRYGTGGENSRTITQTMLVIESTKLDLPAFSLQSESTGLFSKLLRSLGFTDIELPGYNEFNSAYKLKGAEKEKVRTAFPHDAVRFLVQNQHEYTTRSIEAAGNQILLYRIAEIVLVEELDTLIELGTKLTDAFER